MDTEFSLAKFVTSTGYEQLSPRVVNATKIDIMDTIGAALAGSVAPGCRQVVELVSEWGGKPEATILVFGTRLPSPLAALANGTMAHALDFDDTHDKAVLHTGVTVVPAALAMAERIGGISGKQFIAAVTMGIEIISRLGLATKMPPSKGWHLTAVYGYFGAATAAGKLVGLGVEEMLNAWGIAYAQAAGNLECVRSGALTKRLQAGQAAQGGLLSALLAQRGITGARDCFEGEAGIFSLYQRGEYEPALLTSGLGQRFEVTNLSFKPYPCCRWTHSPIDAALKLVVEHRLEPNHIKEVMVGVSKNGFPLAEPVGVKRHPRNAVDAQFSIHYTVAVALVKKAVTIEDFSSSAVQDPSILQLTPRVTVEIDNQIDMMSSDREIAGARVSVTTWTGEVYSAVVERAKGDQSNPMSTEEFVRKFKYCSKHVAKPLSNSRIELAIEALTHLEEKSDVAEIAEILSVS